MAGLFVFGEGPRMPTQNRLRFFVGGVRPEAALRAAEQS